MTELPNQTGTWLDIIGILISVILVAAMLIWVERRMIGIWQDRLGPNRVGPLGLMQVVADMIKIFFKDDWVPPFADKPVFILAPMIIMITTLTAFAVVPFAPGIGIIEFNFGLLYFLALSSLSVYAVVLGAYASNNKYALLGGVRAAAPGGRGGGVGSVGVGPGNPPERTGGAGKQQSVRDNEGGRPEEGKGKRGACSEAPGLQPGRDRGREGRDRGGI